MKLGDLAALIDRSVIGDPTTEVSNIAIDSRQVTPGTLFCCVPGQVTDGHSFVQQAIASGASALIVERELDVDVPMLVVPSVRNILGPVSLEVFDHPEQRLALVGITGTNGKTTTAMLLEAILHNAGIRELTVGTLTGVRTTPEAPDLVRALHEFSQGGNGTVVMEVSSHALDQHRVGGLLFDVAVFTNLSQDHLDYHGNMEQYFAAKAQLFNKTQAKRGCVNEDDEYGRRLLDRMEIPMDTYSLRNIRDLDYTEQFTQFVWQGQLIHLYLPAEHNVYNALAAATAAKALGVDEETIANGISSVRDVPGRMERISAGQPFQVFVDYAHTPAGLEHAIVACRRYVGNGGTLRLVFGCGGDRDREKRPLMGAIAEKFADDVIVTSDNPRSEEPKAIIEEILAGVQNRPELRVELDRAQAIHDVIGDARENDVVLIAGKGHETGQEVAGVTQPFDDRTEARASLTEAGYNE